MTYDDDTCLCGGDAAHCALEERHTGPRAAMATRHDEELAERARLLAYDRPAPRDHAAESCACAERNALFRSLGYSAGVCLPCSARASRGLRANDATTTAATRAA